MEKIVTILGTRPEIIRLSRIIPLLDRHFKNIIVHTGQNYDYELNKVFFDDLGVRKPNYYLDAKGSFGNQLSEISKKLEKIIYSEKPNKFLVLGDTNSSLGAIIAARMGVNVYHMEAGNRSFIKNSPEEINRKIIDHVSSFNLPYTKRSCENLVAEGIKRHKIFITGNPIYEVINFYQTKAAKSKILDKLNLKENEYIVCTMHRQENVDYVENLKKFIFLLQNLSKKLKMKVIWPVHPRTKNIILKKKIKINKKNIFLIQPIGFLNFLKLQIKSFIVVTDSGTVQEESSILKIPCLVFRENTERPETIENGDTIIINKYNYDFNSLNFDILKKKNINNIQEYHLPNVSEIVLKILLSDLKI